MAELANFPRSYFSQLGQCATPISIGGMEKLAMVLCVDILDLLAKMDPISELEPQREAKQLKTFS